MPPTVDITGQRYGMLVAIAREENGSSNTTRWRCRCDCGREIVVRTNALRAGRTVGCGCTRAARARDLGHRNGLGEEGILRQQYRVHRNNASRLGCAPLPRAVWEAIVRQPCHYCGQSEMRSGYAGGAGGTMPLVGVDRIDSNLGYVEGNTVPCCSTCNRAKLDASYGDFIEWVRRVAQNLKIISGRTDCAPAANAEIPSSGKGP